MRVNRRVALFASSALLAGLVLSGCQKKPDAAQKASAPAPEVTVVTVKTEPVTITTELSGRTSPYMISEVRPQVSGIIQKRLFTEGGDVRAGAVLYQIDPATYQAALDSAKASLSKAEANVAVARVKEQRYKSLVDINAVSRQDYDNALASLKQAEADVAGSKAAVEAARINLNYTRVSAPISGRISKSDFTPGALVTANQPTALTTVQQLDPIYVDVTQSSADMLRLRREFSSKELEKTSSAKAKLIMEDGVQYEMEGRLQFSDVTVDQSTGSVTLRAVFPNPKGVLLPGMYVRAVLEEGKNTQAILVPQKGVTRNPKGDATAMVVAEDGSVSIRPIMVSRAMGDKWLVTGGLVAGDKVIVEGTQRVRFTPPQPNNPNPPAPKVKAVEQGASAAQSAPAAAH